MNCANCGTELPTDTAFCHNCGAQVHPSAAAGTGRRASLLTAAAAGVSGAVVATVLVVVLMLVVQPFSDNSGSGKAAQTLDEFVAEAKASNVASIEVDGSTLNYKLRGDDVTYKTKTEMGDTVGQLLRDAGIAPEYFPSITIRN